MNEQEIEALVNELTAAGATEQEIATILDEKLAAKPVAGQSVQQSVQAPLPSNTASNVAPQEGGAGFQNLKNLAPKLFQDASGVLGMFNRGVTQVISEPLKLLGAVQELTTDKLLNLAGVETGKPLVTSAGETVTQFTEDFNPVTPEFQASTGGQVAQGLGQAAGMIASGGFSSVPQLAAQGVAKTGFIPAALETAKAVGKSTVSRPGFIGGSMVASPEWAAAKEAGLDDADAFEVLVGNYLVGQTEALPIQNILGKLNRATNNSLVNGLKAMGSGGLQEGVQEGVQTYLTNEIAKGNYDPDRDPFFQVLESAKVGGLVGLLLPGIGSIVQSAPAKVKQKLEEKLVTLSADEAIAQVDTGDPNINLAVDQTGELSPEEQSIVNTDTPKPPATEPSVQETPAFTETEQPQVSEQYTRSGIKEAESVESIPDQVQTPSQLAQEFNDSGVLLGQTQEGQKPIIAEQVADFLRSKNIKEEQKVNEFVDEFNALPIEGKPVLKIADARRAYELLATPKSQPFNGETVTRTVNEEIKRITQERVKGKTEGVRVGQDFKNNLVERVQESMKESNLTPKQISTILTKIRRTNAFTSGSVSKLGQFVNKVMTDANYADTVNQAYNYQSQIKKQAKSKAIPQNIRNTAKEFSRIDLENFDSVEDYNQLAEHISSGLSSPKGNKYSGFDEFKVTNVINKARQKQEQEEFRRELGDFTEEEIDEMVEKGESVDAFLANKEEAKRVEALDKLRTKTEYAKLALESEPGLGEYASDEDEHEILRSFLSADTNKMSADAMVSYIRSVDNILENGDFSGSQKTAIKIQASQAVQSLLEQTQKNKKSEIGYLREEAFHLGQLIDTIYNSNAITGDFQAESGVDGILSAGSDTNTTFHSKTNQVTDFANQLDKKYKGDKTLSKENEVKMLMIGVLSRTTDGKTHLPKVKSNMEQSIRLYEQSTDKEDQKLGAAMRKAYDPYKGAETSEDILEIAKKQEPKAYESWKWAQDNLFDSQFTAASKRTTNNLYNQSFVPEKNYFPYSQRNMTSSTTEADGEAGKPAALTLRPQQSSNTLKATRSLSTGHAYDTNVWKNLFKAYKSTLYDTKSAKHIQLLHEVTSHPDFEKIVGGKENKKKLVDTLKKVVAEQYGKTQNDGELIRAINDFLHIGKDLGTATALGGADQIFSQTIPTWVAASANLGSDAGLMFMPNAVSMIPGQETQFEKEVISKSRVGEAGQRHGGTDLGELSNKFISDDNKVPFLRGLESVRRFTGKASHIKLFFLTKGDVLVRRRAFSAFYVQRLIQQGVDPKTINLNTEGSKQSDPTRKKAKAYADNMVANLQVPSNRAEMAQILQKGGGYDTLRTIFMPFSVFPLNTKNRLARGIKKAQVNPSEGLKEIGGVLGESAMFSMVKTYMIAGVYYPMIEWVFRKMFGVEEPEEEKDEEGNFWKEELGDFMELKDFRKMLTNVVNDISPLAIGMGQTANAAIINRIGFMSRDKEQYGDYTYDEWLAETKGVINTPYESDFSDFGVMGVGAQKLYDMGNALEDFGTAGPGDEDTIYYNTIYGEQEADVSEMKDLVFFNALMETIDLAAPREFGNAWNKVYSQQLKDYTPSEGRKRRRGNRPQQ